MLLFEVRGLITNEEKNIRIGNIFYGEKGYLTTGDGGWQSYLGEKGEPGPGAKAASEIDPHFQNFVDAVKSRNPKVLNANIQDGHLSAALCHLANISYRTGRKLVFDPGTESFPGDSEANAYLTRQYRKPFVAPDRV